MSGPQSLQCEFRSSGVIIRFTNRDIIERKTETMKAVGQFIKAHQVKAALVDFRGIPGEVSFLDRYELGETAARYLPSIPLAVLMLKAQADRDRIGITVAANRGTHIEHFTDPAAAETWFKKHAELEAPG